MSDQKPAIAGRKNDPELLPQFDPEAHYGEVYGEQGVNFVQGRNYFGHRKQFVREAPEAAWLTPLSAEQERERQKKLRENKKFFGAAKAQRNDGGVPESVVKAERENAQARAAEHRAA